MGNNDCYSVNSDYCFNISISEQCYSHKPGAADYAKMKFRRLVVTPTKLLDYLTQGYSICHIFTDNKRVKRNFLYTNCVFLDVDDSTVSMAEFLNGVDYKPTLAYTTPSNNLPGKGYRFRLIYVLDDKIRTEGEYKDFYFYLVEQLHLEDTKDKCGSVVSQLMNGNANYNVEVFNSSRIYSYENINFFSQVVF